MIPIRPWQLIMLLLLALGAILPLGGRALDLALNGRTDLEIGSRITPDRPLAPDPPVQISLSGEAPIRVDQFALHPFATFRVEALILSKKKQRWPVADAAAELAPLDLALGWGLMSTPQEIAKLRIWQWGRFFYWQVRDGERFNTGTAIPLAANIHLIPADDTVRSALMRAREGDLIRLEGRLVDAHHPDMGWWRSSRTRADTGDGACEILLVERVVPRAGRTAK
jgi:hypothetical protein